MTALAAIKDDAIRAFLAYARQSGGAQWNVREIYDADHGWRVEWTVGDKWLRLQPVAARKLARAIDGSYRAAFRATPASQRNRAQEEGMLAWLAVFDGHSKDCLRKNRDGELPPVGQL